MTAAIRDVVVKIRLEQQQAKLAAPDATAVRDLFKQLKAEQEALFRNAPPLSMPGLPGGGSGGRPDDTFKKLREQIKPLRGEMEDLLLPLGKVRVDLGKIAEQDAARKVNELNRANTQLRKSSFEAAEGLKRAGEGIFTMARGVALLSASGDEELRVVLERIAMFQGAFDIFKGGTDTIIGLVKAYSSLRQVTTSQIVANNALAASEVALAVTGGGGGGGGLLSEVAGDLRSKAVDAAIGGIGGGTAGAVAGGGGAAAGAAGAGAMGMIGAAALPVGLMIAGTAGLIGIERLLMGDKSVNRLPDAPAGFSGPDANQIRFEREQRELEQRFRDQRRQFMPISKQLEMESGRVAGNMSPGRFQGVNFVGDTGGLTVRGAAAAGTTDVRGDTEGGLAQADAIIEKNKTLQSNLQDRLSAEQNIYNLITQQAQARLGELDVVKQQLELAQQQKDVESGRLQSFEERLGRMSAKDFREFSRLRDKATGGEELSQRELQRLEQLGGQATSRFVGNQFAERGRERGGVNNFVGVDDGVVGETQTRLADAQTRIGQILSDFGGSAQGIADEMENVKTNLVAAQQQQQATLVAIVDQLKDVSTKNAKLEEEVQRLRDKATKGKSA